MDWGKIVYPALAAVFTAILFWIWDQLKEVPSVVVPTGMVAAFDRDDCPIGWREFAPATGRTVIGIGKTDGLSERKLREAGGEEAHVLTIEEMPAHNHGGIWGGTENVAGMIDPGPHTQGHVQIPMEGGGSPHNNMPPYVALRYCKKT